MAYTLRHAINIQQIAFGDMEAQKAHFLDTLLPCAERQAFPSSLWEALRPHGCHQACCKALEKDCCGLLTNDP